MRCCNIITVIISKIKYPHGKLLPCGCIKIDKCTIDRIDNLVIEVYKRGIMPGFTKDRGEHFMIFTKDRKDLSLVIDLKTLELEPKKSFINKRRMIRAKIWPDVPISYRKLIKNWLSGIENIDDAPANFANYKRTVLQWNLENDLKKGDCGFVDFNDIDVNEAVKKILK